MFYLIGVAHRVQQYEEWQTLNENQLRLTEATRGVVLRRPEAPFPGTSAAPWFSHTSAGGIASPEVHRRAVGDFWRKVSAKNREKNCGGNWGECGEIWGESPQ